MVAPLRLSFSVAKTCGARTPFQSKLELRIASMKSPLGAWSVHWRWPWKPPRMALRPIASSPKPSSARRGLPTRMSLVIRVILTTVSQSRSSSSRLFCLSGVLRSAPSVQFAFVQASAASNSTGS